MRIQLSFSSGIIIYLFIDYLIESCHKYILLFLNLEIQLFIKECKRVYFYELAEMNQLISAVQNWNYLNFTAD